MDPEMKRTMKSVGHDMSAVDSEACTSLNESHVDFNRLYGDLCKKLLSTPVDEIFPGVVPGVTTNRVTSTTGSVSPNNIHPAFPTPVTMNSTQLGYLTNFYNPSGLLMTPVVPGAIPHVSPKQEVPGSDGTVHSVGGASPESGLYSLTKGQHPVSDTSAFMEDMVDIDIQKLVDEFRTTLERYGVSQRFAARFIMQDTSQGNLSFLMEKGRNKKWANLSARGRIPYLKMKAWLENKDHQMKTLDMLKYSQESKQNVLREAYNRRERFTMFQLNVLCRLFEENPNPPMNIRNAVAERLGITPDRVNVWFQNQRARGFPARKLLQQRFCEQGNDSYLGTDVENMKHRINEANLLPNVVQGSTDASLYKKETDRNGSTQTSGNLLNRMSASVTDSNLYYKSKPEDKEFPLDLSSASNLEVTRISESSSPVTDSLVVRDISLGPHLNEDLNLFDNVKHDLLRNKASHINPSTKSLTCGAAKRKRGSKPQQIITTNDIKTDDTTNLLGTNSGTKRRKIEEIHSPESNYTYLLQTSDTARETSKQVGRLSNDYDYIIKSESSVDTDSLIWSKGIRSSVKREQVISNDEAENGITSDIENLPGNDKEEYLTNGSIKEELPTKSVELFKAMCASLALTEENSKDVDLKEPDLD